MRKPTRRDIWSDPAAARERLRASSAAWNYGEPQEEEGYFLVAWRRGDRAVVGVRYRIGGDDGES